MSVLPVEIGILLVTTTGVGLAARRLLGGDAPVARSFAECAITGACALAALLPALFLLGLPRAAVAGVAYAFATFGYWRWSRGWLTPITAANVLLGVAFAVVLAGPLLTAATAPLPSLDALMTWWPKVEEVATGRAPDYAHTSPVHLNPSYPRGTAWLTNLACPWWQPTPATMQVVAWTWTWLVALVMVAFARRLGRPALGFTTASVWVLLPDVASLAGEGLNDGAMAAAILLAAIGLGCRRDTADGRALALWAAVGASAIKEEGKLVLVVVTAFLLADAWRHRLPRRSLIVLLAPVALLAPHWLASSHARATRLDVLPALLRDPEVLVARALAVLELMFAGIAQQPSWSGLVVVTSLLVLVPRGPRPLPAAPALLFLPASAVVYTCSGAHVPWHVETTIGRLMLQLLPTLLLAAGARMVAPAGRQVVAGPTIAHDPDVAPTRRGASTR